MDEPILRSSSAVLLSTDSSTLFTLKEEPDEDPIDATFKGPAHGCARRLLEQHNYVYSKKEAFFQDVMCIVIAMAASFSRNMQISKLKGDSGIFVDDWGSPAASMHGIGKSKSSSTPNNDDGPDENHRPYFGIPYSVPIERLCDSARFLFKERRVAINTVNYYIRMFTSFPLHAIGEPPGPTSSILRSWNTLEAVWSNIRFLAISLSIIVFAFAHVIDLDACSDAQLHENASALRATSLFMRLATWDGTSPVDISSDHCFEVVSSLLIGEFSGADYSQACLLSARGWSVFLSTVTAADPGSINKGFISIRKGVPCRNNVWKHQVIDAPLSFAYGESWQIVARLRAEISTCNKSPVECGKPLCGERGDSFLVSLRLMHHIPGEEKPAVRRTGYNELFSALWPCRRTSSCTQVSSDYNRITLPPSCVAVSGFGDFIGLDFGTKVYICLTFGNKASRWWALLTIAMLGDDKSPYKAVLIQGLDCCLSCAEDQALATSGECFLVL